MIHRNNSIHENEFLLRDSQSEHIIHLNVNFDCAFIGRGIECSFKKYEAQKARHQKRFLLGSLDADLMKL